MRAHGETVQPVDAETAVLVDRPRLVQQLIYHDGERGVMITAPAGWGKTTVAQQWSAVAGDATGRGGAKLVVESESASATWEQIRDALMASGSLTSPAEPDPGAIAAGLAGVTRPTFIRLDDFHRAEPQLAEDIVELIANTPHWVNIVMITRDTVPSALRSLIDDGEIRVMTTRDLAFRPAEVVALWKKVHREEPRAADVERVLSRTQGQPSAVKESIANLSG